MLGNIARQAAAGLFGVPLSPYDAVAARARAQISGFTNWLAVNNVQGYVGEYGWPQTSPAGSDTHYDSRWDAVADQWFKAIDAAGLYATAWCTSDWGIDLKAYRNADNGSTPLSIITSVGTQIEKYPSHGAILRGVNLVGAEFGAAGPNGAVYAGSVGTQYTYPNTNDWAFLAGRGVKLVRLSFRWERLQPTLKGPLNSAEAGRIQAALAAANSAGIKVLVNSHNFGRYDTNASTNSSYSTSGVLDLGQNAPSAIGGTMSSCFADFWQRVATTLQGTPGLWGYGLTNEPHDLSGGAASWQSASALAVEAIRQVDTAGYISVAGYSYSTIPRWVSENGSTPWLTGTIPAGQPNAGQARNRDPFVVFEGHHYWDNDQSGTYASDYASELANAQSQGYTSYRA